MMSTMEIRFNTEVAKQLSMHEAIFLGWLEHNYDGAPIKVDSLEMHFDFWKDETLYRVLLKLEERQLIRVQRNAEDFCVFSINQATFTELTGQTAQNSLPAGSHAILDTNLKKHLRRFQSSDSLLNKKLSSLIAENSQDLLEYAVSEGVSTEAAASSLDKFLHYVSANPDRFWNTDLISYWRFWISNTREKQGSTQPGQGKRSAIERSNEHAASNWLKKKMASKQIHSNIPISRK